MQEGGSPHAQGRRPIQVRDSKANQPVDRERTSASGQRESLRYRTIPPHSNAVKSPKARHHPNLNERRIVNKRETFRFGCEEFRPTRSCSRFANFFGSAPSQKYIFCEFYWAVATAWECQRVKRRKSVVIRSACLGGVWPRACWTGELGYRRFGNGCHATVCTGSDGCVPRIQWWCARYYGDHTRSLVESRAERDRLGFDVPRRQPPHGRRLVYL